MDFGAIIKRAWQIMWRHKALWALGIFAGVSGCQSGFSGGGSGWRTDPADMQRFTDFSEMSWRHGEVLSAVERIWPALVAFALLVLALTIIWWILSIAARGGLIVAVSEIEESRPRRLGELWRSGFSRFWPLVGLGLLLNGPLILLAVGLAALFAVPLVTALVAGTDYSAGALLAPVCGSLVIGVPLVVVASVVLGIMYLLGQRYIMLGGQGPLQAAGNAWRFLRARPKDTVLMYLLNAALNLAAGMAMVIPIIVVGFGLGLSLAMGIAARNWGVAVGFGLLLFAAVTVISFAYTALWGTFTSALWTLFFRDLTGMAALTANATSLPEPFPSPDQPLYPSPGPDQPPAPPVADA